jgi:hypothetical protein
VLAKILNNKAIDSEHLTCQLCNARHPEHQQESNQVAMGAKQNAWHMLRVDTVTFANRKYVVLFCCLTMTA